MSTSKWIFTIISFLSIASETFAEDLFEYRLRRFETTNQLDLCNSKVKALSAEFAAATGVAIISASCRFQEHDEKYLLGVISYSAEAKVDISTVMSPYGDGANDFAIYDSLEGCEADQSRQLAFFKIATGLDPFVAYCYADSNGTRRRHGLQIDALGKSEVRQFVGGLGIVSDIAAPNDHFFQSIADRMVAIGATVSDVRFSRAYSWNQIRINYYAKQRLSIESNFSLKFESADACKVELNRVNSVFMEADPRFIATYCEVGNGLNGNRLAVATAMPMEESLDHVYKLHMLDSSYPTRVACESDLPRINELLANRGLKAIATICGLNQRQFAVHTFLKN
jgi:hypothetical protein